MVVDKVLEVKAKNMVIQIRLARNHLRGGAVSCPSNAWRGISVSSRGWCIYKTCIFNEASISYRDTLGKGSPSLSLREERPFMSAAISQRHYDITSVMHVALVADGNDKASLIVRKRTVALMPFSSS